MGVLFERIIDGMEDHTSWTALSDDTDNKADSTVCVRGDGAVTFDKVDGADNKVWAGGHKTLSSALNLETGIDPWNYLTWYCYVPDLTDVASAWIRLGIDATNYLEYAVPDTDLTALQFTCCRIPLYAFTGTAGTACPLNSVLWIAFGVSFDAAGDALAGLIVDHISIQPAALVAA